MADTDQTTAAPCLFDFDAYPADTLFHDRRTGLVDPAPDAGPKAAAPRKERRRRVDPTTFEKQYTTEELEFMKAMQDFKFRSGKTFPSHGDVLDVAFALGYRRPAGEPSVATAE